MTTEGRRGPSVALALALGALFLWLLLGTTESVGYARDEGFYFHASRRYAEWFRLLAEDRGKALSRAQIDAAWTINHEHPGLIKSLFALSHLLSTKLRWFSEPGTSFRFPAMVLGSVMVALTSYWASRRHGLWAGLVAGLSLAFLPRVFFHAHLACFDVPITALFLLTFACWDKALRSAGPLYPLLTGVAFGLALDSKHNAWFLPIAFAAHTLLCLIWARLERRALWPAVERQVWSLVSMALLGPVILVMFWPWLWHDTVARFREYAAFHVNHEFYNMELFGETYFQPPMPRSYAPVMTLATVPLITIAVGVVGVAVRVLDFVKDRSEERRSSHLTTLSWALAIGVSYAPWLSTSTPIFGGTKHWMTAYPFFGLFAATGFVWLVERVSSLARETQRERGASWAVRAAAPVAAVCVTASPIEQALRAHPWGLSAYTPLVGGAPGAATLGLNRGFWGYTTGSVTTELNSLPERTKVYPHDTALPSWNMLLEDGRLRRDLRAVWYVPEADVAVYHHEMHMQMQEYQAWIAFGTVQPWVVRGLDGVPVVWLYRRPD